MSENRERICPDIAEPTNIVIFGAAGDLTKRKLIPALLKMIRCGLVNRDSKIIGVVNNRSFETWLEIIRTSIEEYASSISMDETQWEEFKANGYTTRKKLSAPKENLLDNDLLLEQLKKLNELKTKGLITEQEFIEQKTKLTRQ